MNDDDINKLCNELSPIYFYFHLAKTLEQELDISDKVRHLEMIRIMKERCDESLTNIRNILHGDV